MRFDQTSFSDIARVLLVFQSSIAIPIPGLQYCIAIQNSKTCSSLLLSEGLDRNGPLVHDVGNRAEQGVQLGEVVCVPVVSSQEVVCTITSRTQQLDCSSGLAYDQHGESGVPGQRRHPQDAHQLQDGPAPPPHSVDDAIVQHQPDLCPLNVGDLPQGVVSATALPM